MPSYAGSSGNATTDAVAERSAAEMNEVAFEPDQPRPAIDEQDLTRRGGGIGDRIRNRGHLGWYLEDTHSSTVIPDHIILRETLCVNPSLAAIHASPCEALSIDCDGN